MRSVDLFKDAARDYFYLIEKGYPEKTIKKIVGDRHKLPGTERSMLYRGITTKESSGRRLLKLATEKEIKGSIVHIDGFNTIITTGSYLNGDTVFISTDGFLRDASEVHGKIFRTSMLDRSVSLILDYLKKHKPEQVNIYFDSQVTGSVQAQKASSVIIKSSGMRGETGVFDSVDEILRKIREGLIATSDSMIIDRSAARVLDLAFYTLKYNFRPAFLDLRELIV